MATTAASLPRRIGRKRYSKSAIDRKQNVRLDKLEGVKRPPVKPKIVKPKFQPKAQVATVKEVKAIVQEAEAKRAVSFTEAGVAGAECWANPFGETVNGGWRAVGAPLPAIEGVHTIVMSTHINKTINLSDYSATNYRCRISYIGLNSANVDCAITTSAGDPDEDTVTPTAQTNFATDQCTGIVTILGNFAGAKARLLGAGIRVNANGAGGATGMLGQLRGLQVTAYPSAASGANWFSYGAQYTTYAGGLKSENLRPLWSSASETSGICVRRRWYDSNTTFNAIPSYAYGNVLPWGPCPAVTISGSNTSSSALVEIVAHYEICIPDNLSPFQYVPEETEPDMERWQAAITKYEWVTAGHSFKPFLDVLKNMWRGVKSAWRNRRAILEDVEDVIQIGGAVGKML